MKNELVIKKCNQCGSMANVLADCTCDNYGIKCCGKEMVILVPNSSEASAEKHLPIYEKVEDEIFVKINHVMEKEHFIEWIALVTDNNQCMHKLYPEQNAEVRFKYIPGSSIYADCNKHGLWKTNVE